MGRRKKPGEYLEPGLRVSQRDMGDIYEQAARVWLWDWNVMPVGLDAMGYLNSLAELLRQAAAGTLTSNYPDPLEKGKS